MRFNVVVIGAGLAGLQCARLLAARGLRVALLDRKPSVASGVQTTGIFVRKTWEDFPLPDEQFGSGIRDVYLYSPAGKSLHLIAERDEFRVGCMEWIYLYLLEQCSRGGVVWMPSTEVVGCTADATGVRLSIVRQRRNDHLTADLVVGADGARSRIARQLGLDRNTQFLVGVEEVVEASDAAPALHCYVDPRLAPGYIAWVVNDGNEAHVGVAGYRNAFDPLQSLLTFRKRLGLTSARLIERRGGLIPVNGILRRISNEHAVLVGDAAGAVSPLTAGGLDGAMRLSSHAASVIAAYLEQRNPSLLRGYNGSAYETRFIARRWMRRAMRLAQSPLVVEAGFAAMRLPAFRALAEHIFFSRGSFPDLRFESAVAAAQ